MVVESGSCHRQLNLLKQPKKRPPDRTRGRLLVSRQSHGVIREDGDEEPSTGKQKRVGQR